MDSKYKMSCIGCGRHIESHRVPYGTAWLCLCGHWIVIFSVNKEAAIFRTGNEESAMQYIVKIGKILGDKNV